MKAIELHFAHAQGDVASFFPAVLHLYLSIHHKKTLERDKGITEKRFQLLKSKKYTLEDLGLYYDITRERVRQIEARIIKNLRLVLNGAVRKGWGVDEKLVTHYKDFLTQLKKDGSVISKPEIEAATIKYFGTSVEDTHLDLFMEVAGYTELLENYSGFSGTFRKSWRISSFDEPKKFESKLKGLEIIFTKNDPIALMDIIINAKRNNTNINEDFIKNTLKACIEVEIIENSAQVKFTHLKSISEKAYRVLQSKKQPMHYAEIAREINFQNNSSVKSKPVTEASLKNQLVSSPLFKNIGKSGEWGISAWNTIENVTIIEAIEQALHKSGQPLQFDNIATYVALIRPDASTKSLKTYLNSKPEKFIKVGPSTFALTAWKMVPDARRTMSKTNMEYFNILVKTCLTQKNPIKLPELIDYISTQLSIAKVTARQLLTKSPHLRIEKQQNEKHKTVFCDNLHFNEKENTEPKVLLRDKIHSIITEILHSHPNIPFKKGELYKKLNNILPCKKPTFYRYLDDLKDFHQFKEYNDYYVIYRYTESLRKIEIDLDAYLASASLKADLARAISNLDEENVDNALNELGRIFESELTDYMQREVTLGKRHISTKDMNRLVDMTNWITAAKTFPRSYHFELLREERNNRSHGKILNAQERKDLFNKAHFLSELFIKNIVLLNNKIPT
ncbi:sigma factor-like helix-turn-helix DNA-binding protein [Pseudomonas quasicaspiana]|uniref:sigma factor-like helix-turn-helix DNA-binding protein n=1 Tax=Pseudomonas quasicaspiana TaxID=2829821 RepID=UPI001E346D86|nr:sigma factor-like helix-turn-helix DNA-binding protein [Pseudomonas quasicaspiana]MCD5972717.1 hypothetical protein [Pseudomonas quasicaspiana]